MQNRCPLTSDLSTKGPILIRLAIKDALLANILNTKLHQALALTSYTSISAFELLCILDERIEGVQVRPD
jgi:hypothetical protein